MTANYSLYIHFPWCVRKCPYCDFNSHEKPNGIPEHDYISALLADLDQDLLRNFVASSTTEVGSIFMGGGTPSLFSPKGIDYLLDQIRQRVNLATKIEVTMEVNPGSISQDSYENRQYKSLISKSGENEPLAEEKLAGYREAGVNRLSLGVQSFDASQLKNLGRIHSPESATRTYQLARAAGFSNINIDLMHGLPSQNLAQAMNDLQHAVDLQPEHISWYQLTIEPNTVFYKQPPSLPNEDALWEIYEAGLSLLAKNDFSRYEVSAFSRPGFRSKHNLNYWSFGNYLGIGAGAHGKHRQGKVFSRSTKTRLPADYLASPNAKYSLVPSSDLLLEYLMNTMRLVDGFSYQQFEENTGLSRTALRPFIERAKTRSMITERGDGIQPSSLGLQFLNELLLLV
ncbi:MAG: radical SAM family heme chaperone HemW [Gammaproteobacteria bacterium]|nr:radical SAM family heme chaperone HemW [Gammaproteobacteria bacterium]